MSKPNKKKQKEVVGWALQNKTTKKIINVYMDRFSARNVALIWGSVDKVIKVRIIPYK